MSWGERGPEAVSAKPRDSQDLLLVFLRTKSVDSVLYYEACMRQQVHRALD